MKQRPLRNRPGSDAPASRDFSRERLQRAFTRANQLHWTAQYIIITGPWANVSGPFVLMLRCDADVGIVPNLFALSCNLCHGEECVRNVAFFALFGSQSPFVHIYCFVATATTTAVTRANINNYSNTKTQDSLSFSLSNSIYVSVCLSVSVSVSLSPPLLPLHPTISVRVSVSVCVTARENGKLI